MNTGTVPVLASDNALGDGFAHYGRIAKTLHILRLADEPGYRRQIKVQANLQEGLHSIARKTLPRPSGQLSTALSGRHGGAVRRARLGPQRPRAVHDAVQGRRGELVACLGWLVV
nr:transposase [Streptomyces viridochromogenes]